MSNFESHKTSGTASCELRHIHTMTHTNVFLIDDDLMFNFIHSQIVKSANLDVAVTTYQEAGKALEKLRTLLPSNDSRYLLFVDINMPGMDGWGFLEGLSQLPASLLNVCEVFMLSSSNDITDIERARTYSVVRGYLSKPLTTRQMQDIYRKEYTSLLVAFNE